MTIAHRYKTVEDTTLRLKNEELQHNRAVARGFFSTEAKETSAGAIPVERGCRS